MAADDRAQVYYSLDIRNNSKEAMDAKEYFGSEEDLGLDNRPSVQSDEFEIVNQSIDIAIEDSKSQIPQGSGLQHCRLGSHPSQNHQEDARAQPGGAMVEALEDPHPIQASRADFYKFLFDDGNWTYLFATSVGWMLLDFTFFMLGVNSSSFVPTMFGEKATNLTTPYSLLIRTQRHIMLSTSIGALTGCALAIWMMAYCSRKKIQIWGFLILGVLFVIVGALYITLPTTNAHVAIVVFYGICQLFYYLGVWSSTLRDT